MCRVNSKTRKCPCQGDEKGSPGNTYSFGCSYQGYNNGCKFRKSTGQPDKYKAIAEENRREVKEILDDLADIASVHMKKYAPGPFHQMTEHSRRAISCRIGSEDSKRPQPFSGATVNLDFCAHNHKDINNKDTGAIGVSYTQCIAISKRHITFHTNLLVNWNNFIISLLTIILPRLLTP